MVVKRHAGLELSVGQVLFHHVNGLEELHEAEILEKQSYSFQMFQGSYSLLKAKVKLSSLKRNIYAAMNFRKHLNLNFAFIKQ